MITGHVSNRRLTYGKRFAAFGGSGYAKMQSGYALCAFLLRHIFLCAGIASQFLYRAQKNVVYLFTLCEIGAE
jgi:hypothetical protein